MKREKLPERNFTKQARNLEKNNFSTVLNKRERKIKKRK